MPVDLAKIEQLRKRAGLTQAEIAARIGMSKQGWSNIIRGRYPNLSVIMLERIAMALEVPAGTLLTE